MKHSMRTEKNLSERSLRVKRSKLKSSILSALLALTLVIGNVGIQIQPVMAAAEAKAAPTCGKEVHAHNDNCYDDGNLKCVKEEHVHNDACAADAQDKEDAKEKAGHGE